MHRVSIVLVVIAALFAAAWVAVEAPGGTQAAFPGANGKIAFTTLNNDTTLHDIYVVNEDGSESPLIAGPANEHISKWSADGQKIAWLQSGPDPYTLWTADADGSNRMMVTTPALIFRHTAGFAWSPDGDEIAFTVSEGLVRINLLSGQVTPVVTNTGNFFIDRPDWSPDGSKIAFFSAGNVWSVNIDGADLRQLTTGSPGSNWGTLAWSPDGTKIAYSEVHDCGGICTIDANGGTPSNIVPLGVVSSPQLAWSPDGAKIIYGRGTAECCLTQLFEVSSLGGQSRQLTTSDRQHHSPDWQPVPSQVQVEFTQAIQRLQTMSELKSDLEEDGMPPVPMVAGKPAVMRVYFPFVELTTQRTVEVSGVVDETRAITLSPEGGCDVVARRRENAGCRSVDFYFTPPEGEWSVTLTVRDDSGTVLSEDEFNLISVKTDDVLIKAVSVCDSMDASGNWLCQDPFPVQRQVSLMRRMFPTANVRVLVTGDVVRRDEDDTFLFPEVIDWWGQINRDLDGRHSETDELFEGLGQQTYYYGLVRNEVPGGILGAAYLDTQGAAGKLSHFPFDGDFDQAPAILAHEMGHAMGIDHTDTDVPNVSGDSGCWLGTRTSLPDYPYQDNMLRSGDGTGDLEVGFDVANGTAIWGDYYFEVMGYCATSPDSEGEGALAPDVTQWITPFSTLQLMKPLGPLSTGPMDPQSATTSGPAEYWLLRGELTDPMHVAFDPIIQVTSEGELDAGSGNHRIEVRGSGGDLLFTRMFSPAHGHGSPSPDQALAEGGQAFSELIPVHAEAASIDVIDPFQTVIGHLDLGGQAPTVDNITLPAAFSGTQTISWSASDPDSTDLHFWVAYSPDGGQTWQSQGQGLTDTSLKLDFGTLAGSDGQGIFRVTASDGVNSSEATSAPFTVASKAPRGEIIGPSETSFYEGDLVWLEAAAFDFDDGSLDGASVTWSSSRDGSLGTGASLPSYDLSVGAHTITMTARDSDDSTATDTITVSVSDAPIVEGEPPGEQRTWGDNNCSGSADPVDALMALRFDAGQNANTGECPAMGEIVQVDGESYPWGDVDCSGVVDPVDGLKLLRHDSGLSVSQEPGCSGIGTPVTVAQVAALTPWWRRLF